MSGVYWGARDVAGVAADGVGTQLFPVGVPAAGSCADTTTWPPATAGDVRRPCNGRATKIEITPAVGQAGYVEIWDCAGLDRSAANNVNSGGVTVTNAYLAAKGTLIQKVLCDDATAPFASIVENVPFNKGLVVRYVGSGNVSVAPFVEGGFTVQPTRAG
jgi:hypothetical protein